MSVGWFWDECGMMRDECRMVVGCVRDGVGMNLGWLWDAVGIVLG